METPAMMKYKLTIQKQEPDPNYDAQLKDYETKVLYGGQNFLTPPTSHLLVKTLEVEVGEETFAAIRKAALETL